MISWIVNLFHVHNWKWEEPYKQNMFYHNLDTDTKFEYWEARQEATCTKCGETKIKVVKKGVY